MREQLLLTPGPTPIHPLAQRALTLPMRGHMDPDVFAANGRIQTDLLELYGAPAGSFACLLSGTGSLGMEAGFVNLLEPGDRVLICTNGSFGERMVEMCRRIGARVTTVTAPPGHAVRQDDVRRELASAAYRLVAVVHGETSTGVLNPAPDIALAAAEAGALVAVDAVTTAGMMPFEMASWQMDYVYTGSQKCLSAPPGVAPVAFSPLAISRVEARRTSVPLWYADLEGLRAYWDRHEYHHTVPVQLHLALEAALRAALDEGLEARRRRVQIVGAAALAALESVGFRAFVAEPDRLPTVLAVALPERLSDLQIRTALRERDVIVAGGLGATAGRIWRLGLMGEAARPAHYARFFEALEQVLGERGLADGFERAVAVAA